MKPTSQLLLLRTTRFSLALNKSSLFPLKSEKGVHSLARGFFRIPTKSVHWLGLVSEFWTERCMLRHSRDEIEYFVVVADSAASALGVRKERKELAYWERREGH